MGKLASHCVRHLHLNNSAIESFGVRLNKVRYVRMLYNIYPEATTSFGVEGLHHCLEFAFKLLDNIGIYLLILIR